MQWGQSTWDFHGHFPSLRRFFVTMASYLDFDEQLDFFLAMFNSFCNRRMFPSIESICIDSRSLFFAKRVLSSSRRWALQVDRLRALAIRVEIEFSGALPDDAMEWAMLAAERQVDGGDCSIGGRAGQQLASNNRLDLPTWCDRLDDSFYGLFSPPLARLIL